MSSQKYDIVLFGATGFTGRLTAAYFANKRNESFTWAIAARNRAKLEAVRDDLQLDESVGLIVADTEDYGSLVAMTRQARVLMTTVGPYMLYGEPLVVACIETGTDYVDITGEPDFVNMLLTKHDRAAQEAGVRIVNCCGFDSIPHDLGAYMVVQSLPDDAKVELAGYVSADASLSGGTWQTAVNSFALGQGVKMPQAARAVEGGGRTVRSQKPRLHREELVKGYALPMPTIDPQIIMRSARALPEYGREFRYAHYFRVASLTNMVGLGAGLAGSVALAQFGPTRRWLQGLRPSGSGPDEEKRARSSFRVSFIGRVNDGERKPLGEVRGGDPGYDETSKMISESALCLALDGAQLPERAGVLTTAVAMGDPLLARLRAADMIFELTELN